MPNYTESTHYPTKLSLIQALKQYSVQSTREVEYPGREPLTLKVLVCNMPNEIESCRLGRALMQYRIPFTVECEDMFKPVTQIIPIGVQ